MALSTRPRRSLGSLLAWSLLAAAVACLLSASAVRASTYTVHPCIGNDPVFDGTGLSLDEFNHNFFDVVGNCRTGGTTIGLVGRNTVDTKIPSSAEWFFTAPPGNQINRVAFDQEFEGPWDPASAEPTNLRWRARAFGSVLPEFIEEFGNTTSRGRVAPPSNGPRVYSVGTNGGPAEFNPGSTVFQVEVGCGQLAGCRANTAENGVTARSSNLEVVLHNFERPTITAVGGPLLDGSVQRGLREVNFTATGPAPGLFFGEVFIDGGAGRVALLPAGSNGGKCQEPFTVLVPCDTGPQTLRKTIDTTVLHDTPPGTSQAVRMVACNAGSDPGVTHSVDPECFLTRRDIEIRNAPVSTSAPPISSTARFGTPVSAAAGGWLNSTQTQLSFAFQWLRCPQSGSCQPIAGATQTGVTQTTYTPVKEDIGTRLEVEVTASANAGLGQVASRTSPQTSPVADSLVNKVPPALSGTAKTGAPLNLKDGTWEDGASSPISIARQWLLCPAAVTGGVQSGQCTAIAGTTQPIYTPVKADVGKKVMVKVTATVTSPEALSDVAFTAPSGIIAAAEAVGPGGPGTAGSPPQTKISKHPRKRTAATLARFRFSADQPAASFQCKLDKRPFKTCRSPLTVKHLKHGRHTFAVRAMSAQGTADPTPARFRWLVE